MADNHSTDAVHGGSGSTDPDRDAKIDDLLLGGLDHYFAGRLQEAINVWGRVLFLDRGHARARAYIERARSAMAERQRQSEQLASEGVAAIQRGDGGAARELLSSAAAHGDSPDLALAYLERLERLGGDPERRSGVPGHAPRRSEPARALTPRALLQRAPRPIRALPLIGLVAAAVAGMFYAASSDVLKPLVDVPWARRAGPSAAVAAPAPLPVPRPSELALARARTQFTSGHLREALAILDGIGAADPAFAEAERLRADVQRALLEIAGIPVERAGTPGPGTRR